MHKKLRVQFKNKNSISIDTVYCVPQIFKGTVRLPFKYCIEQSFLLEFFCIKTKGRENSEEIFIPILTKKQPQPTSRM